ncbi:DUF4190 domain-containing protein [Mycolicibacterium sp.]|uniref:DUF4190 domain-containing protein n=1 Tax=Mycolicibacterium sp. TaxID=2320850 RepID=UPI0028AE279B|nr:DUF4190 domain-containing protein [Mycolicibacterium sp.]
MTAASGDPGETPPNDSGLPPQAGGYQPLPAEPLPVEPWPVEPPPAYGGFGIPPAQSYPAYGPPAYPAPAQPGFPPSNGYGPPPGSYLPPPPPGYPPLPGYAGYDYRAGHPRDLPGTNTLAILSIIASVVSLFCVVSSAVGIVLGLVAINQIKRTRQEGYGLAIAGIVLGAASLFVYLFFMVANSR